MCRSLPNYWDGPSIDALWGSQEAYPWAGCYEGEECEWYTVEAQEGVWTYFLDDENNG